MASCLAVQRSRMMSSISGGRRSKRPAGRQGGGVLGGLAVEAVARLATTALRRRPAALLRSIAACRSGPLVLAGVRCAEGPAGRLCAVVWRSAMRWLLLAGVALLGTAGAGREPAVAGGAGACCWLR